MSRLTIAVVALLFASCSAPAEEEVLVRFEDAAHKAQYLAILDRKEIKYRAEADGWIAVQAESIDELKRATPEYDEWRNAQLRELNNSQKAP